AWSESESAWRPLATGAGLAPGSRVRTRPDTKCAIDCEDGSEGRVDVETELRIGSARHGELESGRGFTKVAPDPARVVDVVQRDGGIEAVGTALDVRRGPRSREENDSPLVTVLTVVEGKARVGSATVEAGYSCEIADASVSAPKAVGDLVMATSWVHEIL